MMRLLILSFFGALMLAQPTLAANSVEGGIADLQHKWAVIKYQVSDPDEQLTQMAALAEEANQLQAQFPSRAEPLIWDAIITSTQAGMKGGMGALKLAKRARDMLDQAIVIDGTALKGSAYTSIGSLYYQVPGGLIGFGSKKKARANLKKALSINPDGIDSNYFYGDFLMSRKKYDEAITVFQHALAAAPRPNRPIADKGRRDEIAVAITQAQVKASKS